MIKHKIFTEVIKMPRWEAWVQEPSGLSKSGRNGKHF